MSDDEGSRRFFEQMNQFYIQPEFERRSKSGQLPTDFSFRQCLIRLPHNKAPIVEFNNEIEWLLKSPELAPGIKLQVGEPVMLHDFVNIQTVLPPKVDNIRVAFVYVFWDGLLYRMLYDFSPNLPGFDHENQGFPLGNSIATHITFRLIEDIVQVSKTILPRLNQAGLWIIPSLLPYPASKIAECISNNRIEEATEILITYCNPDYIENELVNSWMQIDVFRERSEIFQEALFAHRSRKFRLAIYTLVPQLEGVITDWLHKNSDLTKEPIRFRPETKMGQFHQIVQTLPQLEPVWREVMNTISEFLGPADAPPLKNFKSWLDTVDTSFPGRHPISHGKYVPEMFNEANSIKLFLLLDTVCWLIMFHQLRKEPSTI